MSKPLRIGITGGIGSGKSIISAVFTLLGIPVYNADNRAKLLMTEDPELQNSIITFFGKESFVDGQLNRQYLAHRVFANQEETTKLNSLVHPAVAIDFAQWVEKQDSPYILKEAALLFETGSYKELDQVILVTAPEELRLLRVRKRDPQRSLEQIRNIINKQMSEVEAIKLADEVLINDGGNLLIPQIIKLDEKIKRTFR